MEPNSFEEIEHIKKLKAKYFRLIDTKQWDAWGELFTQDVTVVYQGPHPDIRCEGRADLVARVRNALAQAVTVHHGHMPEIELTSPTTATGIWAMFDIVQSPQLSFKGYGHYEEEYAKQAGTWRIKNLLLTRLHCDVTKESAERP